ncbi:FAD-binding and (Fe-S)-binding domain-containing protein [Salinisphaera aquimarina]|uniref:FAD-binding and (Fe-S)-binding domain-containing protein n=1 Tax=Salinisphaera aquimarina TaxID=2094031 RepID=A0ABV7EPW4_9GAMM
MGHETLARQAHAAPTGAGPADATDSRLARRLRTELEGDVLFDDFSRGRYSTDASIYQIRPLGVVVPRTQDDVHKTLAIARDAGVCVLPRGGGTSQNGQTVNEAVVIDTSKYLNNVVSLDTENRIAVVEPGLVLDHLNAHLKPHGLMYPVDVSTSAQATLGGMAGNNSCGTRSLRYGNMVHNVRALDAVLADGSAHHFGRLDDEAALAAASPAYRALAQQMTALHAREADELARYFPDVNRRVGGYNLNELAANIPGRHPNLAKLLIGSEGTLAFFQSIKIDLQPTVTHKVLGICHFPTFRKAMEAAKPIVALKPAAAELVDATLIELGREIDIFRPVMERYIRGQPQAVLLVEFAGDNYDEQVGHLRRLGELMADLGYPDGVVEALTPAQQQEMWGVRKAGLNIMMSMKGDGKPVSFIEDCAVPLDDLPDYTERLTEVFHKHGTEGTWYAHASEGCLHVRPIINLKDPAGAPKMRAIAEEAFAMVREYKGSHSGEHGDGISRSEFHEAMFGTRLVEAFGEIKHGFDPNGLFNPHKITDPLRMDDTRLMRFKPDYRIIPLKATLDWSAHGGFAGAVEMCNNNGACRKFDAAVMCPSYRATRDEQHVTRGRANSLRLALSGQLGDDAFTSPEMYDTLSQCVSCKGCKRECPTGVDMAKMKVEFLHHYHKRHGRSLRDKLIAELPRYAPKIAWLGWLLNLRDRIPGLAKLSEKITGFSARRPLPVWHAKPFRERASTGTARVGEVVLFADTFSRWQEPDNLRAAAKVLSAAGYQVHIASPEDGGRPLCCGRTYLAVGDTDKARDEAQRTLRAVAPYVARGVPVVGLEPSCLLTMRDEFRSLLPGKPAEELAANALLFEEFIQREHDAQRLQLELTPMPGQRALVHGHCHQKAFGVFSSVEKTLRLIPELEVETINSTCCGMAGAFGYQAEHYDTSMAIGELGVLPAARAAGDDVHLVADGTSCRHQIHDGARRRAVHAAVLLARQLKGRAAA